MQNIRISPVVQESEGSALEWASFLVYMAGFGTKIYDIWDMSADERATYGYPSLLTYVADEVNGAFIEQARLGDKSTEYKQESFLLHAAIIGVVNAVELIVTTVLFFTNLSTSVDLSQVGDAFKGIDTFAEAFQVPFEQAWEIFFKYGAFWTSSVLKSAGLGGYLYLWYTDPEFGFE